MKCPINEYYIYEFTATYKSYNRRQKQQNISLRGSGDSKNSVTPRWHYSSLRQQLLKSHCRDDKMTNKNIDRNSENIEIELRSIENQEIESSQNHDIEVGNDEYTNDVNYNFNTNYIIITFSFSVKIFKNGKIAK